MADKTQIEKDLLELYEPDVLKVLNEEALPFIDEETGKYLGLILYRLEEEYDGKALVLTGIKSHLGSGFSWKIKKMVINLAKINKCTNIRTYSQNQKFKNYLAGLGFVEHETIHRYYVNG